MFLCHLLQVSIKRWQLIGFTAIDRVVSRYEIPKLVMRNKTPRHKVIDSIMPDTYLQTCIDAVDITAYPYHIIPEPALFDERVIGTGTTDSR